MNLTSMYTNYTVLLSIFEYTVILDFAEIFDCSVWKFCLRIVIDTAESDKAGDKFCQIFSKNLFLNWKRKFHEIFYIVFHDSNLFDPCREKNRFGEIETIDSQLL